MQSLLSFPLSLFLSFLSHLFFLLLPPHFLNLGVSDDDVEDACEADVLIDSDDGRECSFSPMARRWRRTHCSLLD
jgi:hypothetical protein